MLLWLRAVVLCLVCVTATLQDAVNVSVYYESLCPDSIAFIRDQLYPTWTVLTEEYLTVDFVPYGKASQYKTSSGHWSFNCQHGSAECVGNKVQACALDALSNDSTKQVEFIDCVMSEQYPPTAGKTCANKLNITYDSIQECINGQKGGKLLAALGDRTHNFQPTITFVPTVAFGGVYNDEDQWASLTNFKAVVCRHLQGTIPSACQQS